MKFPSDFFGSWSGDGINASFGGFKKSKGVETASVVLPISAKRVLRKDAAFSIDRVLLIEPLDDLAYNALSY